MAHLSPADTLKELWTQQRYMEALTIAWQAPPVYSYHLLMPRGGEITLHELIVRSCQQALAAQDQAARTAAQTWVITLLSQFPPPPALIDHSDGNEAETYREQVIRAYLESVRVALTLSNESQPLLEAFVPASHEVGFPPGFLRDLAGSLQPPRNGSGNLAQPEKAIRLTALLVGATRGVAATLTLELIKDGTGSLYPSPTLAFVRRDAACQQAEQEARRWSGLVSQAYDVRWLLQRFDGQAISALIGPSLGGAFSLGLAALFGAPEGVADLELELIGATAAVDASGALSKIGGLWQKLGEQTIDLARRGLLHAVVVAAAQDDVPVAYLEETAEPLRVLKAENVAGAIEQLQTHLFPRHAVRQYQREQCQQLDLLGRAASLAEHYQPVPLLREIKRERLLRGKLRATDAIASSGAREEAQDTLRQVDIRQWEEALQESQSIYEEMSFEQIFQDFSAVAKAASSIVPRFVVLGPPGSGKSTLVQYLAWRAANDELRNADHSLIPVRVRLRDWEAWLTEAGNAGQGLSEYLTHCFADLARPPTVAQWRRWLQRGEMLLLFDGLDEVERKPAFLSVCKSTLSLFSTCPTVITCRTVSFEQHRALCPDFAVFTLAGLNQVQQEAYIHTFPIEYPDTYDPEALVDQLRRSPQLQPLAANPLLLSIICSVVARSRHAIMPHTRGELYQKMLEQLLSIRLRRVDPQYPGRALEVDDQLVILRRLALRLFVAKEQRLTFSAEELREALISTLTQEHYGHESAALWANALRTDFTQNSGILRSSPEQGFFFLHLTVHEFLVAMMLAALINNQGWEAALEVSSTRVNVRRFIDSKAWDPHWQEVLTFLAGQLRDPVPLFKLLTEEKKDDVFRHRLALAARCLAELAAPAQHSTLVNQVTTQAFSFWFHHLSKDTAATVPHLTRALPTLGQVNGDVDSLPLRQWLTQQLHQAKAELRLNAAEALGKIGEAVAQDEPALSALAAALQDVDEGVRAEAAEALRRIGAAAAQHSEVIPALMRAVKQDVNWFVRFGATRALQQIGVLPPTQVQTAQDTLPAAVQRDGMETQRVTTRLVEKAGALQLVNSLPALTEALFHKDARQRAQAVQTLGQYEASVMQRTKTLAALVQVALHDRESNIRLRTFDSLARVGATREASPTMRLALLQALQRDKDARVRARAARELRWFGKAAVGVSDILLALISALEDEDSEVRTEAAQSLGEIMMQGARVFRRWWKKVEGRQVEDLAALS